MWQLYVNRYIMITPIVAFSILFFIAFPDSLENTAMFRRETQIGNCRMYWWSALFHIQNYVNPHNVVSLSMSMP